MVIEEPEVQPPLLQDDISLPARNADVNYPGENTVSLQLVPDTSDVHDTGLGFTEPETLAEKSAIQPSDKTVNTLPTGTV